MTGEKFVLGVNYWPRRKAMYWWRDFDADEVRTEFAQISDIGMDVVRIFLLWDDWMPAPDQISDECLAHLGTVLDAATDNDLGLDITFFTGHMSGPNWAPGWMLDADAPYPSQGKVRQVVSDAQPVDSSYLNMFSDPRVVSAAKLLLRRVVTRYKDHPAVWMWNLGNEPDLFAWAEDNSQARAWVAEMTALIKSIDPVHPVTCGLHVDSLVRDNTLRVDHVYGETDVAVMHGYPMYMDFVQDPLDSDFVPFLCALTTALCGLPTLAEEWGGCTTQANDSEVWTWTAYGEPRQQFMASEQAFATYIEQVLPKLLKVGATGSLIWCYADYVEDLWGKPPCDESKHERFFGLVRPGGTLKPHAEVIRRFAAAHPTVQPATRTVTLDVSPDEYYQNAALHIQRLYQKFTEANHATG